MKTTAHNPPLLVSQRALLADFLGTSPSYRPDEPNDSTAQTGGFTEYHTQGANLGMIP
ncbi:MAG: hypothetical protein NTV14_04220 [Coprothermobacterota bacterium]|nr:hypothetical protein [Coprothermobacterota bacterium]